MREDNKVHLRHRVLNLLTTLQLLLGEKRLTKVNKAIMINCLNSITILLEFEDFILGKNPDLFQQKINIGELIRDTFDKSESIPILLKSKIQISFQECYILADRFYLSKALEMILNNISVKSNILNIFINQNSIIINHDNESIKNFQNTPMIEYVKSNVLENDFCISLGIAILKAMAFPVKINMQQIIISFKHKMYSSSVHKDIVV